MSFIPDNPNPHEKSVGDCTVRALSIALDETWDNIYTALCLRGFLMCDMPSANHVWGAFLREHGFYLRMLPDQCPDCYTVAEFSADHPHGVYILALSGHVVCVKDGHWHDTWDSGGGVPLYYWSKE